MQHLIDATGANGMMKTTVADPKPATIMIRMPVDLHRECKSEAALEQIDLTTWYARAVAKYLKDMRTAP
jgi:predicted HicB family RNase H-like nuclease